METPLSRKADTAMYEDEDDDRFEAAARLAEVDEAQAAEALRSIVADDVFDPTPAPKQRQDWPKSAVDHNGIRPRAIEPVTRKAKSPGERR